MRRPCPLRPRSRPPRRRGRGRARASRRHDRRARPTCSAPRSRRAARRRDSRRPRRRGARRRPTHPRGREAAAISARAASELLVARVERGLDATGGRMPGGEQHGGVVEVLLGERLDADGAGGGEAGHPTIVGATRPRLRSQDERSIRHRLAPARPWGAARGAGPEGTVRGVRARKAPCRERRQAAAEPGSAGRERSPARGAREPQDADGRGAPARRRAGARRPAVPRRRQQPRVPRVLRAARRSSRRRTASRRTRYWASRTCSSSSSRTTSRTASRSRGTRGRRIARRSPRRTRRAGARCRTCSASSSPTSGRSWRRSATGTSSSRAGRRTT